MPDDLRWSWCDKNRSKVHDERNVFESHLNHPPPLFQGKIVIHKANPSAKKVVDHCYK